MASKRNSEEEPDQKDLKKKYRPIEDFFKSSQKEKSLRDQSSIKSDLQKPGKPTLHIETDSSVAGVKSCSDQVQSGPSHSNTHITCVNAQQLDEEITEESPEITNTMTENKKQDSAINMKFLEIFRPSTTSGYTRKRVRCTLCLANLGAVRRETYRNRLPHICTPEGTEYRTEVAESHIKSDIHQTCLKAKQISSLNEAEKTAEVPIRYMVSKANKQLCDKIGGWMYHVYNDAKSLTLAANNWPSRIVASEMQKLFDINKPFGPFESTDFDLQYLNPAFHNELLDAIVQSDLPRFREQVSAVQAASFRCDASADRMQQDNQFLLLKTMDTHGKEDMLFLGIGKVTEAGAAGHVQALYKGTEQFIDFNHILKHINHITTDGENKNTGKHKGLWTQLDTKREELGAEYPLLKSVCAVHTSALVFKDVCKSVCEVQHMIEKVGGIASFFHSSPRQTSDLEKIAEVNALSLKRLPRWFEVRWAEFTYDLLDAVLVSWKALIMFSQQSTLSQAKGFGKLLSEVNNLRLMCFTADVLFLLKNLQMTLQSDSITIVDLDPKIGEFIQKIKHLAEKPLLGGWEEVLENELNDTEETLKSVKLWKKERRTGKRNEFVSDHREFSAIRNDIICAVENFMSSRFELAISDKLTKSMTAFCKLIATDDDIRNVHEGIGPDTELAELAYQYDTITQRYQADEKPCKALLQTISGQEEFTTLSKILCRILVCKPQSADCERLISAYSLLKAPGRSLLQNSTLANYLYIRINMPKLATFDPRPATLFWLNKKLRRVSNPTKCDKQKWFANTFEADQVDFVPTAKAEKKHKKTF